MAVYTLEQIHKRLSEGLPLDNDEGYDLLSYYFAMRSAFADHLHSYFKGGLSREQAIKIAEQECRKYA